MRPRGAFTEARGHPSSRSGNRRGLGRALAAAAALALSAGALPAAEVRFEINDAQVKETPVAGTRIVAAAQAGAEPVASGVTDESGVAVLELEPGTYWISYARAGYIPIRDSETVIRAGGQTITTTLSRLLEAEGPVARRVRIVLNWGSDEEDDVRDVDGHAYCACGREDAHVYYGAMRHGHEGHGLELDVDDIDWGGPETITLNDPPAGVYGYRVHQFSQDEADLGSSDLVVRVFFDDRQAAELRPPANAGRHWVPFGSLVVGPDLTPRLVPFDAAEIAAGADLEPPAEPLAEEDDDDLGWGPLLFLAIVLGVILVRVAARLLRRR